jgi:hypothetical protein
MLLMLPFPEILTSRKHTAIASKLNHFGRSPTAFHRAGEAAKIEQAARD